MTKFKILLVYLIFMFFGIFIQISQASTNSLKESDDEDYNKKIISLTYNPTKNTQADFNEKNSKKDNIKSLNLQSLPKEVIIHIANYLLGDNFQNFALASKSLNDIVMSHQPFFMPQTLEDINQVIENTPLREVRNLTSKWSRTPKGRAISLLHTSLKNFDDYLFNEGKSLKALGKNFKNRVKIVNALYSFRDPQSVAIFKTDYQKVQRGVDSQIDYEDINHNIPNKNLYLFYQKCFSLLSKEVRYSLSSIYREGKFSIPVNTAKADKYAQDLNLLLDASIIDWKH